MPIIKTAAAGLSSPLKRWLESKKAPGANTAEGWAQQLLSPEMRPNPDFNAMQLTLPGITPRPKSIPTGEFLSNIPGVSKQELKVTGLGSHLKNLPPKQKVTKQEIAQHVEDNYPRYNREVYSGKEISDDDVLKHAERLRRQAESDAYDDPYHVVEVAGDPVELPNGDFEVTLRGDMDGDQKISISLDQAKSYSTDPMYGAIKAADDEAERMTNRNIESTLEQIWDDEYYDEMARDTLSENVGTAGPSGPARYLKYIENADPDTYHELALRAWHPDYDMGNVGHFDNEDIVSHILADRPSPGVARLHEIQSDAAQNWEEGQNILYPTSDKANAAAMRSWLSYMHEEGMLPNRVELPDPGDVARRWRQESSPIKQTGWQITPTTTRSTMHISDGFPNARGYSEPITKEIAEPAFEMLPTSEGGLLTKQSRTVKPDELQGALGQYAKYLTPEHITKGGVIPFEKPVDVSGGLFKYYNDILPNTINDAFKQYGVKVDDSRGFNITDQLREALSRGEMNTFRHGGRV